MTSKIIAAAQNGAEAILWLLMVLSVISLGIIIERYFTLRLVRQHTVRVKRRLQDILKTNNLDELEEMSKDRESVEGRALAYAFRHMKDSSNRGLTEIFNGIIVMERASLEKHLGFLATVGSNGPFIGLLGTVMGIMKAFSDLGVSQGNAASSVMAGIGEALVATAVGLFVAIPAVVAYNYFQRQVRQTFQNLEGLKELSIAYSKSKGSI